MRLRILLLALLLSGGCQFLAISQTHTGDEVDPRARKYFFDAVSRKHKRQYKLALTNLKKALEIDSTYVDALMLMSNIYHQQGKNNKEEKTLKRILRLDASFANAHFNLGALYLSTGKYSKSRVHFKAFLSNFEDPESKYVQNAKKFLKRAEFGIKVKRFPVPFDPVNIGPEVNTELDEYWPVLTADKKTLYFTRKLMKNPKARGLYKYNEDIYFSTRDENKWTEARKPPGELNSMANNEGAISLTPDGKHLVFTGCQWKNSYGRCDLYYSQYKNGAWQKLKNLGKPVNSPAKETQPTLSFDGNTLYFASDRKGTHGNLDIWVSRKDSNGNWREPENLGNNINTKKDDQSPFIHPDNQTLYFSSFGHPGLGKSDLFISRRLKNGRFGKPENLGYPINNHADQYSIFITADGKQAYFATEKINGKGGLDIYRFPLYKDARPYPVTYLKGNVFDAVTKVKLEAKFELLDLKTGKLVIRSYSDAKTGEFLVPLQSNHNYALNVSKDGYLFFSEHLPLKEYASPKSFLMDVPLEPIRVGAKVTLKNIFFEFDSYELMKKSKVELNKLIQFMKKNKQIRIEISGHTDNRGTEQYNLKLSRNRAKTVYQYLIDYGDIVPSRLEYRGYGESKPVRPNKTEEDRAANRRTEFKIIDS